MVKQSISLPFDGKKLREHRERAGMHHVDLAQRCMEVSGHQVDRSRISQLENGVGKPSPPLLRALTEALGVSVDDLLAEPQDRSETEETTSGAA